MASERIRVFLSWSGPRSKAVAAALRDWLPQLFNVVDPWMSEEDIGKGTRWSPAIARALDQCRFGIVCVTAENWSAPWLLFEAGALSKAVGDDARVFTYLLGVSPSEIQGPLTEFQATRAVEDDTRRLVRDLNNVLGEHRRTDVQLDEAFSVWWPRLREKLEAIPPLTEGAAAPPRSLESMVGELLELERDQSRNLKHLDATARFVTGSFIRQTLVAPGEKTTDSFWDLLGPDEQIALMDDQIAKARAAGSTDHIPYFEYQRELAKLRKRYENTLPKLDLSKLPLFGPIDTVLLPPPAEPSM